MCYSGMHNVNFFNDGMTRVREVARALSKRVL